MSESGYKDFEWENSLELKKALKLVLKYEIHCLLRRLSETGEESVVITASAAEGSASHLCSKKGEDFLQIENLEAVKHNFLSYCKVVSEPSLSKRPRLETFTPPSRAAPKEQSEVSPREQSSEEITIIEPVSIKSEPVDLDLDLDLQVSELTECPQPQEQKNMPSVSHESSQAHRVVAQTIHGPIDRVSVHEKESNMGLGQGPTLHSMSDSFNLFVKHEAKEDSPGMISEVSLNILRTEFDMEFMSHKSDCLSANDSFAKAPCVSPTNLADVRKKKTSKRSTCSMTNSKLATDNRLSRESVPIDEVIDQHGHIQAGTFIKDKTSIGSTEDKDGTLLDTTESKNKSLNRTYGVRNENSIKKDGKDKDLMSFQIQCQDTSLCSEHGLLTRTAADKESVTPPKRFYLPIKFESVTESSIHEIEHSPVPGEKTFDMFESRMNLDKIESYSGEMLDLTLSSTDEESDRFYNDDNREDPSHWSQSDNLSTHVENKHKNRFINENMPVYAVSSASKSNPLPNISELYCQTSIHNAKVQYNRPTIQQSTRLEYRFGNKTYTEETAFIDFGLNLMKCLICNKVLRSMTYKKRHWNIHVGQKPHTCEFCGWQFADQSNLKKHRMRHTGERPCSCVYCDKKFWRHSFLRKHLQNEHGYKQ